MGCFENHVCTKHSLKFISLGEAAASPCLALVSGLIEGVDKAARTKRCCLPRNGKQEKYYS